MLIVDNLHAGYGASEVLVGTSLQVKAGSLVAFDRTERCGQDHDHARHLRVAEADEGKGVA